MKNTKNKKVEKIDKLDAIRQHPAYKKAFDAAGARIKLAIEINEARVKKGWSQQELAKKAETTQKVISKIESGDMNVGLDLVRRISDCLDLEFRVGATALGGESSSTGTVYFRPIAGTENFPRGVTVSDIIASSSSETKTEHKQYEQA